MKAGDMVEVINPDNSFYGKRGVIVEIKPTKETIFCDVFLKREKVTFMQYDLQLLPPKEA